jgi:hypothetical protein
MRYSTGIGPVPDTVRVADPVKVCTLHVSDPTLINVSVPPEA